MSKTVLLIDGNAMIHQGAYFMPRTLCNDEGFPVWAIKGFIQLLFGAVNKFQPTHTVVFFDCQSQKRIDLSKGTYKAHRGKNHNEEKAEEQRLIREQFKPIRKIVKSLGFPVVRIKGHEADDLIGTYAVKLAGDSTRVLIRARDKDFNQLVNENIQVVDTWGGGLTIRDKQYVVDRYGVTPKKFALYLALVGDSADNIGKIAGIGPKTAVSLIKEHKTFKNIVKSFKKKKDRETLRLGYKLTKIDLEACEVPKLKELKRKETSKAYSKLSKKYALAKKRRP